MAKFRKKPVVIEATQWFKNGDHPLDNCIMLAASGKIEMEKGEPFLSEGKVVRYYRHSGIPETNVCEQCGNTMHVHGWIDTLEGGHNVCPSDWIITGVENENYPCKPDIFEKTYEAVVSP